MCGIDDGYEDYPYLYFPLPVDTAYIDKTLCLASCPSSGTLPSELECVKNSYFSNSCTATKNIDESTTLSSLVYTGTDIFVYKTTGCKSS